MIRIILGIYTYCIYYAIQVPATRLTRDASINEKKTLQRNAQIKIIDALCKYPDISLECWGKVEAMLKARDIDSEDDLLNWNSQYKKINRLPTYWMVQCAFFMEGP